MMLLKPSVPTEEKKAIQDAAYVIIPLSFKERILATKIFSRNDNTAWATLPKNIQERRQKELQELNERGMQMQQDAQQQLQQSWLQMLEPIAKKIDDAIKSVGQEGGYVYIFDLNATQIPFVNETLSTDVTGAVKAKLGL